ncbi:MAG TPA: 30S ribosomal protein S4 [Gemmatimonas aurantiaca]|uniref:Small ribosomal subunit protein uS4 n=2 Tax=Gemmatimonas aurantiaca TaxID=173480 RepID=C1ABG6_GEMAT|nr:30S ribosomal protein S4 [Gemmatimonas aurantiaca]BAH39843.1 30S ribosomal protein S4 [Gemmatimonas aurantiaca T-27]HCT58146.1 30S ribosomal protein S4 [Gemmatimonas aurantiaca]
MSRVGPRLKIIRRLGIQLPGLTAKDAERRPYPPGQHGQSTARRRKVSLYRLRLEAKQALRFYYGISENQLRRTYAMAKTRPGRTGDVMLAMLEARLDNVVFRLGFARTIPAARQLVVHGHVYVNGSRVDRPGYRLRTGEMIKLDPRMAENPHVQEQLQRGPQVKLPGWLAKTDDAPLEGRMIAPPTRESVPFACNDAAIVEYYAR